MDPAAAQDTQPQETQQPPVDKGAESSTADETQELAALWDKSQQEPEDHVAHETPLDETPQDDAAAVDPPADEAEATSADDAKPAAADDQRTLTELPRVVRDAWPDIPEAARSAILTSQQDMGRKLAEQGRLVQGIAPIRDVLVDAAKSIPSLKDMKPGEIASQVMTLADYAGQFNDKPVETLMALAEKHGAVDGLREALSGTTQNSSQPSLDPRQIEGLVETVVERTDMRKSVNDFAAKADHWPAVEKEMPRFVMAAQQLAPESSPADILDLAYEMAVEWLVPPEKAKPTEAATLAATDVDPEKTQGALNAKSVNVKSRPNGKGRTLSEDEELAAVYSKMQEQ